MYYSFRGGETAAGPYGTRCHPKVNVITCQTLRLLCSKLRLLYHHKSLRASIHWWAAAYFWISCLHDSYWLFRHVNTNKSEIIYDTVTGDRCHKIFFFSPPTTAIFLFAKCLTCDQIESWHEQTLALLLMDPALTQNVYLSQMCHQVYEQQIANLKNMSPVIQINPINPNFHLLTAHSSGLASSGIYFLACLFSEA